jgi:hypothetical protein
MVSVAARDLTPHVIAQYLRELAAALHAWYNAEQFLVEDAALRNARLALAVGTRQVLRNGLGFWVSVRRNPCNVRLVCVIFARYVCDGAVNVR